MSDDPSRVKLIVENLGGIDHAELAFGPGVTILPGRNATNRTSLLSALGGVLGGSTASLKSDADEGRVTMTLAGTEYTRTYSRRAGTVHVDGTPYTDDGTLVDHFVTLFEDNPARRAVERGDDLRDVIMRPVDTAAIEHRISELQSEKGDLEQEIQQVSQRMETLPALEERRTSLENEIDAIDEELADLRAGVEEHEADIDTAEEAAAVVETLSTKRQQQGRLTDRLETKEAERDALEEELDSLEEELAETQATDRSELDEIEAELRTVRERKRQLDETIASLTTIVEFNQSVLAGDHDLPASATGSTDVTQALAPDDERELTCWTCGSTVDRGTIDDQLDDLRDVVAEKRTERDDLLERAEALQDRRRELDRSVDRHGTLERRIDETEAKLESAAARIEELESEIDRIGAEISDLEAEAADTQAIRDEDLLDQYDEIGDLEYERGQLEQQLADVEDEIETIESLPDVDELESRLDEVDTELQEERGRIETLERDAVEAFNDHMAELLDLLAYENLARVWIERKTGDGPRDETTFDLHIVRETAERAGYEDTVDNLSESEREVIGLVLGLAGYLVHDVHETVPFMLLDSVEAIDATRLEAVIQYFSEYAEYLLIALLPEDADQIDEGYARETVPAVPA